MTPRKVITAYPRGYSVDNVETNARTNHWSVLLDCGHTVQTSNPRGRTTSANPKRGMVVECEACTVREEECSE